MKDISNFLIEAKKNTYANGKALRTNSLRQGSSDYHFEVKIDNKKTIYHATYFGGKKFIGEEVVYLESEKPFWGMNYYGYSLNDDEYENAIANALRPALMQVGIDKKVLPLRGPSRFVNGDYIYTFEYNGTLESFTGIEKIYKNNELIYELHCHGGIIK